MPVPKSVIFIRKASSSRRFSGFRSLEKRKNCKGQRSSPEDGAEGAGCHLPMDDSLGVHIPQCVNDLSRIIAHAVDREGAHARYSGLQFTVLREVQHEDCARTSNAEASDRAVARLT